jgi:hypothetical protein
MKVPHLLWFLIGATVCLGAEAPAERPKDSVEITPHSSFRAGTSPGASMPDRISLNLEVRYVLTSERDAVISLALDEHEDMTFTTFGTQKAWAGNRTVDLAASVRLIQRPVLHCLVILKKKGAQPSDPPLALTGMEIDIKRLTRR